MAPHLRETRSSDGFDARTARERVAADIVASHLHLD
jgi:hypothetical protein